MNRSFFCARRFLPADQDLKHRLLEWLTAVNEERPSRATKVIPVERMVAERERMKPLPIPPAEYGLRYAVHVGPTALVEFKGIRYAMPAGACGIPATLHLYPERVKVVTSGGRFEAVNPRFVCIKRLYRLRNLHRGTHEPPTSAELVHILWLATGAIAAFNTS
ncbi:MAG: hypothetical protein ACRELT_09640 [Longimicrobiales bacterium]